MVYETTEPPEAACVFTSGVLSELVIVFCKRRKKTKKKKIALESGLFLAWPIKIVKI